MSFYKVALNLLQADFTVSHVDVLSFDHQNVCQTHREVSVSIIQLLFDFFFFFCTAVEKLTLLFAVTSINQHLPAFQRFIVL